METKAPDGYIAAGDITFKATSEKTEDGLVLKAKDFGNTVQNAKDVKVKQGEILVKVENTPKTGNFELELIKYIKDTETKLAGAVFDVTIAEGDKTIYEGKNLVTNVEGKLVEVGSTTKNPSDVSITKLPISKAGVTYTVTISETKATDGYIAIDDDITFTAVSKETATGFELVSKKVNVQNAKRVEVKADEILVEAENDKKTVEEGKGEFALNLIKLSKNTVTGLKDAKFNVTIEKALGEGSEANSGADSEKTTIYNGTNLVTDETGKLVETEGTTRNPDGVSITKLPIEKAGEKYTITITETEAPTGYVGISDAIVINTEYSRRR